MSPIWKHNSFCYQNLNLETQFNLEARFNLESKAQSVTTSSISETHEAVREEL